MDLVKKTVVYPWAGQVTAQDYDPTALLPEGSTPKSYRNAGKVLGFMQFYNIAVDANRNFRDSKTWALLPMTCESIANRMYVITGGSAKAAVSVRYLTELVDIMAKRRRSRIIGDFIGFPTNEMYKQHFAEFVKAITGREDKADLTVMRHFLWQVKRKMAGLQVKRHLMPALIGKQGSGKSTAIVKLVSVLQELANPAGTIELITDDRSRPALAQQFVVFLDELSGLAKADAAEMKRVITSETVSYRPMKTNENIVIPNNTVFIGSSNPSIAELFRDTSGMRRFYELKTPDLCDWKAINATDYKGLWQFAVSENDHCPLDECPEIFADIQARQAELTATDPLEDMLAGRWWEETVVRDKATGDAVTLCEVNPEVPILPAALYARYVAHCERSGEYARSMAMMGRTLARLGWTQWRSNGIRYWVKK